jgi:hypothetical protein
MPSQSYLCSYHLEPSCSRLKIITSINLLFAATLKERFHALLPPLGNKDIPECTQGTTCPNKPDVPACRALLLPHSGLCQHYSLLQYVLKDKTPVLTTKRANRGLLPRLKPHSCNVPLYAFREDPTQHTDVPVVRSEVCCYSNQS